MERDHQDIFLSPPWRRRDDDRDLFEPAVGEHERLLITAVVVAFGLVLFVAVAVGVAACVAGAR